MAWGDFFRVPNILVKESNCEWTLLILAPADGQVSQLINFPFRLSLVQPQLAPTTFWLKIKGSCISHKDGQEKEWEGNFYGGQHFLRLPCWQTGLLTSASETLLSLNVFKSTLDLEIKWKKGNLINNFFCLKIICKMRT